ncbi:winged helix-turn-helix transcriptional regulator [candidate division WOR-3 bacterium]|nr:winged helix-turn-helix transcriptional regulator [candidate division WOR-3 bacterium]
MKKRKKIPEKRYRASRICRALGNPTAYEALHLLSSGKRSPAELAQLLGVSIPTVSHVLRVLRDLDLVRYEVTWREHTYWLKAATMKDFMTGLEMLVGTITRMQ